MDAYCGIDPGKNGAIAIIIPDRRVYFFDLTESRADIYSWLGLMKTKLNIQHTALEDVHSIYGMSAKSNFIFGRNVEKIHCICELAGYLVKLVQPKVWQKTIGITVKGKDIKMAVANKATKLYPNCDIWGKRGGLLNGRSDSLMLAHYCYLTYKLVKT